VGLHQCLLFRCPIPNALVLGEQDPSVRSAIRNPLLIRDVAGVVRVVISDEVDDVAGLPQLAAVILPKLRSKKNSGSSAEDILADVHGQAVVIGDRCESLAISP
jgi:hypothetical protein